MILIKQLKFFEDIKVLHFTSLALRACNGLRGRIRAPGGRRYDRKCPCQRSWEQSRINWD